MTAKNLSTELRMRFNKLFHRRSSQNDDSEIPEEELNKRNQAESLQNRRFTPPESERVTLRCLWAAEFYSPAHLDGLTKKLHEFGWSDRQNMFESEGPVQWLSKTRHDDVGWRWKSLGFIANETTNSEESPEITHVVPMPAGVDHAHVVISVISPSLVAVCTCFTFGSELGEKFETALRKNRQASSRKYKDGWLHYLPGSQQVNEIRQIRHDIVDLASSWFSKTLPGVFSSGFLGTQLPTCEFLTFREADPFPEQPQATPCRIRDHLMTMGVFWRDNAWVMDQYPEKKFSPPHEVFIGPPNHCVLAAKESEVHNPFHCGDEYTLPKILSAGAILPLLEEYNNVIRKNIDLIALRPTDSKNVIPMLESIANPDHIDMPTVMAELAVGIEEKPRPFGSMPALIPLHPATSVATSLENLLVVAIKHRLTQVQKMNRDTTDRLTRFGSLLGTLEDVRLQKKISCLTYVLTAIGLITIAIGIVSIAILVCSDSPPQICKPGFYEQIARNAFDLMNSMLQN